MNPLDEFKQEVRNRLPGLIVLFDIADAKRRNCHLGYRVVDNDIEEMGRLVQESVGPLGIAKRVGGDKWLALYAGESLEPMNALLSAYYQEQQLYVGWKTTAEKENQTKSIERTVPAKIFRSLRCIYSPVAESQAVDAVIDSMFKYNYGLQPDVPHHLSDVVTTEKAAWTCVTRYPVESPSCPFCGGREFDWEDGDFGVYTGSGTCKQCTASVDIRGVEQF